VLSDVADVVYKTSAYYDPERESGFSYADPAVGIEWSSDVELTASRRDAAAPTLSAITESLPFTYRP
jgi:dTDP-4-dehydrorhamnose 3,5-epimerase